MSVCLCVCLCVCDSQMPPRGKVRFFSRPRQRDNYIPLKGTMVSRQGVAISVRRALGRGESLQIEQTLM